MVRDMTQDKKKRAQPSNKRRKQKQQERLRKPGEVTERAAPAEVSDVSAPNPDLPGGPESPKPRKRPGEGLDKSDEGVIAGSRLAASRRSE